MKGRYKLKDAQGYVGIFEIIDDTVYVDYDEIDAFPVVNNIVDAGSKFHIDIMRHQIVMEDLSEDTKAFYEKHKTDPNLHRYFDRGRICFNFNTMRYELYTNSKVAHDVETIRQILRVFRIPGNKVDVFVDEQHYCKLER